MHESGDSTQEEDQSFIWATLSISQQYFTFSSESKCVPLCHRGADLINVCMSTNDPAFITAGKCNLLTRCILLINGVVGKYRMKMKEHTSQMLCKVFSSAFICGLKLKLLIFGLGEFHFREKCKHISVLHKGVNESWLQTCNTTSLGSFWVSNKFTLKVTLI